MQVREIMTTDVLALAPACTIAEVAQAMRDQGVSAIPLVENGRLVGIITDRDIVARVVADGLDPHFEQAQLHMTPDPLTVPPECDVEAAALLMSRQQIGRLPVVEGDRLVGYLAMGDIRRSQAVQEQASGNAERKTADV